MMLESRGIFWLLYTLSSGIMVRHGSAAVRSGLGALLFCLIADQSACLLDECRMHGSLPSPKSVLVWNEIDFESIDRKSIFRRGIHVCQCLLSKGCLCKPLHGLYDDQEPALKAASWGI